MGNFSPPVKVKNKMLISFHKVLALQYIYTISVFTKKKKGKIPAFCVCDGSQSNSKINVHSYLVFVHMCVCVFVLPLERPIVQFEHNDTDYTFSCCRTCAQPPSQRIRSWLVVTWRWAEAWRQATLSGSSGATSWGAPSPLTRDTATMVCSFWVFLNFVHQLFRLKFL